MEGQPPPAGQGPPPAQPQPPAQPPPAQAPPAQAPPPPYVLPAPKPIPPGVQGRELAGYGSRVGALLLDALIGTGVTIVLGLIIGLPAYLLIDGGSTAIGVVIAVVLGLPALIFVWLLQPLFMRREGERNGQTLGKQIVGITTVRDGGESMSFGWAFLRQVLVIQWIPGALNSFALVFIIPLGTIALLIDYLWPLWDENDNRCLHDMICKTHVVEV